jgi:hypothetical protein
MLKGICYIDGGKMYLEPKNRHILILPIEDKKEKSTIILPDDYKSPESPFITCDILGMADDCSLTANVGDRIIVERRMISEIKAMSITNYLVLENYVYGRLQDE